ncbi:GspH/FimT family pseudopilin [Opacimonas viscosa]|uniref:Type II secretion system protein H n=1 Tax=Opacimonas viscosa TaxID=2961944 RepID=A0AA41X5E4_9ALTE|nr:GspH/FimT family pseudopilin [Opacimonas viscosa]MCP3428939.1 GspH/FimT family pseudopilin [Opacimonas viscosa]
MKQQYGLTLLEMMIALSILAITFTFVGPSANQLYQKNLIIGELNHTSSVIQFARHHAINTKNTTIICPTSDFVSCGTDWNSHKMVFVDDNANNILDGDEIILTTLTQTTDVLISGPSSPVQFNFNGASASPATIKICAQDANDTSARGLFISLQGRATVSKDSDNDGIHETNSGTALSCS